MTKCTISLANQKGGVSKSTSATNLAQAFVLQGHKVLLVDLDPQGNATQGLGIELASVRSSVADLIRDKEITPEKAIYRGPGIDVIPATPVLSEIEGLMYGMTNADLRLRNQLQKVRSEYNFIIIDTPPTFGPLLNSALNASGKIIVPVDSSYFALVGIKELLSEVETIKEGTNPDLEILGYLLTIVDRTRIASETLDELVASFGEKVFETRIRRCVKLKEAPVLGRTIFQHAPKSAGAEDYLQLSLEVLQRVGFDQSSHLALVGGAQ